MKNKFYLLIMLLLQAVPLLAQQSMHPYAFVENKGQWHSDVRYMFKNSNYYAWVTDFGIVYNYYHFSTTNTGDTILSGDVIRMAFRNNSKYSYTASSPLITKYNYFYGNDPEQWATDVSLFSEVMATDVYRNVDVRYYIDSSNGYNLRYDFIVKPGGNPNDICYTLEGNDSIATVNGELLLWTSNGEYKHTNLMAYQVAEQKKHNVACDFAYTDAVAFSLGEYDKDKTLVIDPLIYSVLLGGYEYDAAYSIAMDNIGCAYITGDVRSLNYPTTTGTYKDTLSTTGSSIPGFTSDCYVSKVASNGKLLYFSTYIGGTRNDVGRYIKVDNDWNIYIVGETQSNATILPDKPFPVLTPDTVLGSYPNGWNVFVTKLNSAGNGLLFSVMLGGSENDYAGGLDFLLDDSGDVIYLAVAAQIESNQVYIPPITTPGAYKPTLTGAQTDCYIAMIDANGTTLEHATFLGGSGDEKPYSLAVGTESYINESDIPVTNYYIYVTGTTTSVDYPTSTGAYQWQYGGNTDCFVTKLNTLLTSVNYSTYIGGSKPDSARGIAVDDMGYAYITGWTMSDNFPTITHINGTGLKADTANIFVTKLNQSGGILLYSTNITSNAGNYATGIVVDNDKYAHISGFTMSNNYPATADAFFTDYSLWGDAIYTVLDADGQNLTFSSFIGGNQYDYGYGLVLDSLNAAYICGATLSNDQFPHSMIFADSIQVIIRYDSTYNSGTGQWTVVPIYGMQKTLGSYDAFIYKATYRPYPGELVTDIDTLGNVYCPGETVTVRIWTPYGFYYPDNIFYVQLSDTEGNFPASPLVIGSLAGTTGGTLDITFPANITPSLNYRIRVYATHPRAYGFPNSLPLSIAPPYIILDSTSFPTTICAGDEIDININSNKCFNAGNVYRLELSDAIGSFATPLVLATATGNGSIVMAAVFPDTLTASNTYKIRCVSTNPAVTSNTVTLSINTPAISVNDAYLAALQGLCDGAHFDFGFNATACFTNANYFYLILSDIDGNFTGVVDTLGFLHSIGASPTVLSCTIPQDLPYSTKYKLKLVATSPYREVVVGNGMLFTFGRAYFNSDGLTNLSFCRDFDADLHINANDCFAANNVFECYIRIGVSWVLLGTSQVGSKDIAIHIPVDNSIGDTAIFQIKATNPEVYSEEIKVALLSPKVTIASTNPAELCAGDAFVARYTTNGCISDTLDVNIELSQDINFGDVVVIGSGKVFGANGNITCALPDSIDATVPNYIRVHSTTGLTSASYMLNINVPDINITSDMTDLEVLCTGISFYINFSVAGCFDIDNVFKVILSDVLGQFDTPGSKVIGEITSNKSGRIFVQIPLDMPEGNVYRIMITSSHPQMRKIINFYIELQHPFIHIDSVSGVDGICDPLPDMSAQSPKVDMMLMALAATSYLYFDVSGCFGDLNEFILEIAKADDTNFVNAVSIDTCAWDGREFHFALPDWLGKDAYRLRVVSTNPRVVSIPWKNEIKFEQPYAKLTTTDDSVRICRNMPYSLAYETTECFDEGNIFYLEMSDASGSFADAIILDYTSTLGLGEFNFVVPEYYIPSNTYKLRIRSTSPAMTFFQLHLTVIVNGPELLTGKLYRLYHPRNDTLYVPFSANCFDADGKNFVVQLSDPYGKFTLNQILEIGFHKGLDSARGIYSRIWLQASDGKGYRVRVICREPEIVGSDNGEDIIIFGDTTFISINDNELDDFSVYPIPFYDRLYVSLNSGLSAEITLMNILGQRVLERTYDESNFYIGTDMLPSGIYYLQVVSGGKMYRKIVLRR
ncbi:MAG: SBBP repeat-containing protein [Ignavibacteria bacterium]|jgi:hypothetical protein|nr:SBBP repeat-containing protein [Ignavibacteria bacterium]